MFVLQTQTARIRALRLRRTARRPWRGSGESTGLMRPAARSDRAGAKSKRGRSDTTASAAEARLSDSFLETLDAALSTDNMLAERIAAAMQALAEAFQDEAPPTGMSVGIERLNSVLEAAVATLGRDATAADTEHLACLLCLAHAVTANAVADAIR